MDSTSTRLPYRQTLSFSKIVLDYIDQTAELKPFFSHPPNLAGIQKAIDSRKQFETKLPYGKANRELLVQQLKMQYDGLACFHNKDNAR